MSPSKDLTERLKDVLPETLGIRYVVFAIGDRFARDGDPELAGTVIDSGLWRTLTLGLAPAPGPGMAGPGQGV